MANLGVFDLGGRVAIVTGSTKVSGKRWPSAFPGIWRKVFSVNLEGPLRMSQYVAPIMREGSHHCGHAHEAYR